ncbi:hypothetical protein M885DRAFT_577767 [Pelagophyceae sp. CCMP2097]|nr:hypothetical protein M885DRAFT_577767 [Pelagophyceae sp. CCMP2097]
MLPRAFVVSLLCVWALRRCSGGASDADGSCADGVRLVRLAGGGAYLVVDDFLPPDAARAAAAAARAAAFAPFSPEHAPDWETRGDSPARLFRPAAAADVFPGVAAPLDAAYEAAARSRLQGLGLTERFSETLGAPDGLRVAWSNASFFGSVCFDAQGLSLAQRARHVDRGGALGSEVQLAVVHYLSAWRPRGGDARSGGTAFYAENGAVVLLRR